MTETNIFIANLHYKVETEEKQGDYKYKHKVYRADRLVAIINSNLAANSKGFKRDLRSYLLH